MKGSYEVLVRNRRIQYKFTINRNITILKGDSATGKTTLIDMILAFQNNKESSGVFISSKCPCVTLSSNNWEMNLSTIQNSIIFIDEGNPFVNSKTFADIIKKSSNYYVIATRNNLFNLPYSVKEIYGIKNVSGNKYQQTKRLYSSFYKLYEKNTTKIIKPELVIVEDSKAGFQFLSYVCNKFSIPCISAAGKSKIYKIILKSPYENIMVIADGAAFGCEIENILSLTKIKNLGIYLPESFEWLILNSNLIKKSEISDILENPSDYIESQKYFSWETFFTDLLRKSTNGTYLEYSKQKLNPAYLQEKESKAILTQIPDIWRNE